VVFKVLDIIKFIFQLNDNKSIDQNLFITLVYTDQLI